MNWKVIARSLKTSDMRKRVFAVFGILVVFRLLAQIPIPLADPTTLRQLLETLFTATQGTQLLGFFDTISGGALANFSIMLIGLGPYINASIIMQLLTQAIPKLETLNKEGEYGRRKINQITRLLVVPLAIIQSIGAIVLVRQAAQSVSGEDILAGATLNTWILMVVALTAGAILLMWLGELITEQSIGNGISLLITAGIVSTMPGIISSIATDIFSGENSFSVFGRTINYDSSTLWIAFALTSLTIITTWVVVKLNEAQRRITINYAKRVQGNRAYGGVTTTLPIKMITAGVIPIIFAVAFLSVPSFAGQIMSGSRYADLGTDMTRVFQNPTSQYLREFENPVTTEFLNFGEPDPVLAQSGVVAQFSLEPFIYPAVYFTLIVMFTFFYTSITFNAKEIAENLQKQGGFIEGIRSGKDTERYLRAVVNRLTLFGSIALGLIALSPIIAQYWINTSITIGGTSILILVAVALETLRQIESRALMITYDDYSSPDYLKGSEDQGEKKPKRRLRKRSA